MLKSLMKKSFYYIENYPCHYVFHPFLLAQVERIFALSITTINLN